MSVALSPDGTHIVAGCAGHTVKVVDAQSGEIAIGPLKGHTDRVRSVAFSPDGTLIASSSQNCTMRLREAQTGETITTLDGHTSRVSSVVFLPDSTYMHPGWMPTHCHYRSQPLSSLVPVIMDSAHPPADQVFPCIVKFNTEPD
jgi:WD40 repeat protein